LHAWSQLNADAWRNRAPDRHAEYLLYQTLIGAWPITHERCWQYMLKASREAKIHTSWHKPNPAYEDKIRGFTEGVFANPEFIGSLESFVKPLIQPGRVNSLAQTLLKMVIPGVPDFYQGMELWDLSLVDPDNRRPVDYGLRTKLLRACEAMSPAAALADWDSGLPKLWMIRRILNYRSKQPHHFGAGIRYEPIAASGSRLSNLFAFRRGDNLVAAVPRFGMSMERDWQDTRLQLPDGKWINLFSDEEFCATATALQIFRDFPVALLVRKSGDGQAD
jgi:(1->4)-alpha-D-glucan 1-alpha-D-glucosylmutase